MYFLSFVLFTIPSFILTERALRLAVHEILAVFGRLVRLVARKQLGLLSLGVNLHMSQKLTEFFKATTTVSP